MGDEVYGHSGSLVGSIGVISVQTALKRALDKNRIGFNEVASSDKLIESQFDPMGRTEIGDEQVEKWKKLQSEIFVPFKNHVLAYRDAKIDEISKVLSL